MNTTEEILVPADLQADADALMESIATGQPLDPVVARRIHERAESIRQETFQKHGVLDIGVPAIRELRDNEDP